VTGPGLSHPPSLLGRWRRLVLAACIIAWAGALAASHVPPADLPEIHVGDKTLHVCGFFVLTGLFWLTLALYGRRRLGRAALVLLVMPLYAALDELTQPWFRRTADVHDWLADAAGAALALLVAEAAAAIFRRGPTSGW